MRGKYVRRVWGWDTHGLPIENLIEKELGFKNKAEIETYGVEIYKSSYRLGDAFESEWKKIIPRLGRWVDMENRYITFSTILIQKVVGGLFLNYIKKAWLMKVIKLCIFVLVVRHH
jgi:isoleucyl-tRNA synthetase